MTPTVKVRADCASAGHCWHERDGSSYQRHNQRERDSEVRVTCCYCGDVRQLPGYANHTAPGTALPNITHGKHLDG